MSSFNSQYIKIPLFGEPSYDTTPQSLVPKHIHRHKDLLGLSEDDHPQYLNTDRGVALFNSLFKNIDIDFQNIGSGSGIFAGKDPVTGSFQLRTLIGDKGITISEEDEVLKISIGLIDGGTY